VYVIFGEEGTVMDALIWLCLQRALYEEMAEKNSTTSHMSDAMTTTEETQITGGNNMSLSLSNILFYFRIAVLVIGVIGTAANGVITYAMIASKQHKKHLLIFNQNALDLFSCIFLAVTYPTKLILNIPLTGSLGYWLCTLFISDAFIWVGNFGGIINLGIITIERYLMVVHSAWSKKKLREWMKYSAMAFTWIGPAVYIATMAFSTTTVMHGICLPYAIFKTKYAKFVYYVFHILTFYVVILFIFILCYGHILIVIRRQAKVMATHSTPQSSTTQAQLNQMQSNVIKTMIFVSAFYAALWLPYYLLRLPYYLFLLITRLFPIVNMNQPIIIAGYYVSVFIAFLYTCMNPFIYATKFEPVKQVLLRMIPWKKTAEQANANVASSGRIIPVAAFRAGDARARD